VEVDVLRKTEERKKSHLDISLKENVEADTSSGFEDVTLVHQALPESTRSEIETSTEFFGHQLKAPVIIESMTGGTAEALKINRLLAECAEKRGYAIGVGSQRAAIENPRLRKTYSVVRDYAPNALVFANIGCPQLASGYGIEEAKAAVEMIKADALMVHSNPLQESIQLEGEPNFKGVLEKMQEIASALNDIPLVLKETGAGISGETAAQIQRAGAKGIDVAGAGGTSWAAVEYFRAVQAGNRLQQTLGKTFREWGIPTCVSVVEASRSTNLTVIASGGLRNGLHIAKSIALGASAGGVALPLLVATMRGKKSLEEVAVSLVEELKTAMFLVGARSLKDLRSVPVVLAGRTAHWLNERGYSTYEYARRKASLRE